MEKEILIEKGVLYLVPTPIGNLRDITFRALETLRKCDIVVCEDTRSAGKLFKLLDLPSKKFISFFDPKESEKVENIVQIINEGYTVALISEAGTPLISDPGYKLVQKCIELGIKIIPLPGATAFVTALVGSGLPVHRFTFFGFPPQKSISKFIDEIINNPYTTIIYISPYKILKFFKLLNGKIELERKICLVRELTKMNEEFIRGSFRQVFNLLTNNEITLKGEFVLLIEGKQCS